MDKALQDRSTDLYIKKILGRFSEMFQTADPSTPKNIFMRDEFMAFSALLYSHTESEKELKNTLSVLKSNAREYISHHYIPALNALRGMEEELHYELQFVEQFNQIEVNFKNLVAYFEKFFYQFDKRETQKCYFLEGTSRQIFEGLFIEIVIISYRHDIIKVIQRWFNNYLVESVGEKPLSDMRVFLGSIAKYIFSDVFIKEKIAKDIETTIFNVADVKMKKFVNGLNSANITTAIKNSVEFKNLLRHTLSSVFDERPFFDNIKTEINSLMNKIVLQNILTRLKQNNFQEINTIIDSNDQVNLAGISALFTDSDDKIEDFKDFFINYISNKGLDILKSSGPNFKEVQQLIEFLTEMDEIIARVFMNNRALRYAKNKALEKIVESAGSASIKSDRDFTKRFYGLLNQMIEERRPISRNFETMSEIASYLNPKAFGQYFSAAFVRRIVDRNYIQKDFIYEEVVLKLFVAKMGEECCQNILSVLRDIETFRNEKKPAFEKFKQNLMLKADSADLNLTVVSKKDYDHQIILKAHPSFKFYETITENFFHSDPKNDKKNIEFDYSCGLCQYEVQFACGVYLLEGPPIILSMLLFLAESSGVSAQKVVSSLVASSPLKESDLLRKFTMVLNYLVNQNLVIVSEGAYSINAKFTSDKKHIELTLPKEKEEQLEGEDDSVQKERYIDIESKIMYLVKKSMRTADELRDMIANKTPNFELSAFRKSLNYLVQNEYLSRRSGNPDIYTYK
jgi:hypothetical protein